MRRTSFLIGAIGAGIGLAAFAALHAAGDSPGGDGFDSDLLAEIGADFDFVGGLSARVAVGLDDQGSDWGIGISWR